MRIIIIVLILTVILIGSGIYTEWAIEKQAAKLQKELDGLQASLLSDNREKIDYYLDKIEALWIKSRRLWVLLIDHQELEDFELSLARTKSFLIKHTQVRNMDNVSFVLAEIATMKQLATQIPDKQSLTLENIF